MDALKGKKKTYYRQKQRDDYRPDNMYHTNEQTNIKEWRMNVYLFGILFHIVLKPIKNDQNTDGVRN
jgi:hypothetical protein